MNIVPKVNYDELDKLDSAILNIVQEANMRVYSDLERLIFRINHILAERDGKKRIDDGVPRCAYTRIDPEKPNEWFEEIQEPTDSIHWKPKIGDKCFILENNNIRHTNYTGMVRDYNAYITGRVFRFEKEAIAAANRELAEVRLRRTSTLNPDPKNGNGGYVVYYDHRSNELRYCSDFFWCNIGIPIRYAGVMDAEKSIKENREDWLIYFGIEEEK